jgi:hypothetical protein
MDREESRQLSHFERGSPGLPFSPRCGPVSAPQDIFSPEDPAQASRVCFVTKSTNQNPLVAEPPGGAAVNSGR